MVRRGNRSYGEQLGSGVDNSEPEADVDEQAQQDPVVDEDRVGVGGDVFEEPADDHVGDDESYAGGQHGLGEVVGAAGLLHGADELVEPGAEDGGDGQQERVAGRGLAGVAHQQSGGDGASGAGDSGDQGHRLGEAVEDAVADAQLLQRL